MKKLPTLFLQAVLLLIGLLVLALLLRFPLTEGRAQNLDLFSIYADPFILYAYAASLAFFVALYKAIRILGYIRQDRLFTPKSVRTLRSIKYCAIILILMIGLGGIYIRIFHAEGDDPAGFLALCMLLIFICIAIATAVAVLERLLQNAVDMKNENDLTI